MKKQKKNNVDYRLYLNCDPRLCSLSRTSCQWLFYVFSFSFLVVPNCIVFSSIENIKNINKLLVQMLRKTTWMRATTVSKFINKAASMLKMLKSACFEMIDIETIEQILNLAPRK